MIEETFFMGLPALRMSDDRLTAVVTIEGPMRVFDFRRLDGPTLFIELPDLTVPSGSGPYPILGGHRLWIGPEQPHTTYAKESRGSTVVEHDDGLSVVAAPDAIGVVKSLRLRARDGSFVIEHAITNGGDQHKELAPWAITQLRIGGCGYVPVSRSQVDEYGFQASDRVAVWPYTQLSDIRFESDCIVVEADRKDPFKVGVGLSEGWLAYRLGDELFVKRTNKLIGTYLDQGAAGQCYSNHLFLELETLGPLIGLEPGASTSHIEAWYAHDLSGLDDRQIAARMAS